ncbi:hypothetical protein JOB18_012790 [Solea senegalensis]|uniref:Uncharacterized protein n=1 Tax=Solea senegalensis TaxID=28829 RepID=A0AAV6Q7K1_SOLSE|nr:hypothetical protein JOB18_012790 [Solea senegalensis]
MQRADITPAGISDLRPVTLCHLPTAVEKENDTPRDRCYVTLQPSQGGQSQISFKYSASFFTKGKTNPTCHLEVCSGRPGRGSDCSICLNPEAPQPQELILLRET